MNWAFEPPKFINPKVPFIIGLADTAWAPYWTLTRPMPYEKHWRVSHMCCAGPTGCSKGRGMSIRTAIYLIKNKYTVVSNRTEPEAWYDHENNRHTFLWTLHSALQGPSWMWLLRYRKISNIRRTKSQNLKDSRLVLQLSLPNPLKRGIKSRMKR